MKFVDIAKILIKAGDGGDGHISFRKEKFVPKGGPDGGNGGKGGDVIFEVDPHMNTLLDFKFKRHFSANNGAKGQKKNCTGKSGDDLIIKVPIGTLVIDAVTEELIADLAEKGQREIVAFGGKGGLGNQEFATATNQTPRYATEGKPGDEFEVVLELKLLADVGIVGFPNVGKSTLISVISSAKPKIADYHFTTLVPNLGIVKISDYRSFVVADIPGLIEGAADGKGLGIQFLRHVERSRALLFMIDAISSDPVADYHILMEELLNYNEEMKFKQKIICINKIDAVDTEYLVDLENLSFDGIKPVLISAATNQNLDKIKWLMWEMIESAKAHDEADS